eukprot:15035231-Alexandrium_andersonii.AAC.1
MKWLGDDLWRNIGDNTPIVAARLWYSVISKTDDSQVSEIANLSLPMAAVVKMWPNRDAVEAALSLRP